MNLLRSAFGTLPALVAAGTCWASSSAPPLDHAAIPWPGEPPRECTACHSGRVNSYSGSLAITQLPSAYLSGQTYALLVELVDPDPGRGVFGFEVAALDSSFAEAGLLEATDAGTERRFDNGRGVGFVRSNPGGKFSTSWPLGWTAPAAGAGEVTFHVCAVAGDLSGTPFADHVFCTVARRQEAQCDPPLGPVARLLGVRRGSGREWSWTMDPQAERGYRVYAVAGADETAGANGRNPRAELVCSTVSAPQTSCLEGSGTGASFLQVVGLCAAGQEGPN